MPTLAIIIVSWNVRDLLRRCLLAVESSLAHGDIDYEIIVVDNASSDGTPAMLRSTFPHVRLLEPGRNLGFTSGNNLALRALGFTGQRPAHDAPPLPWSVLLLNPDTEPIGDALPQLVHYLQSHPDVIAVGPRLCYPDGSMQSSRRRFPTRLTFFWESTPLERLWPGNPWAQWYHYADRASNPGGLPPAGQCVDWLVGAALLVRGAAIAHAGLLDEAFFMYSEELEWQWRLQGAAGSRQPARDPRLSIVYVPRAVVVHHEGKSSEQVLVERHLNFQRSKLRLAQRLYGRVFALLLRIFLLLCYTWELAVEGAKYVLGHRRDLRRQRIGVYTVVLRSGLR